MQITDTKIWAPTSLVLVICLLLYLLAPILTPFVIGALLAYLSDPLIDRLEALKIPRGLAVASVFTIVITVICVMILLLVPMLQNQFDILHERLPRYIDVIDQHLSSFAVQLGITTESLNLRELTKEYLPKLGSATNSMLKAISKSGSALISGVLIFTITPIITFYLLRDWDNLVAAIHDLVPHSARETVNRLTRKSDATLSAFIRGQFLVMTALGAVYSAGLSIVGLQLALLIGFIAGLLSFIPYFGTLVGLVLASALYIAEYQEFYGLWKIGVVFIIGQALEGYFLTPLLVGDKIGLHPVAVIFAVLAGGQLFGFVGVLLALPISSVLVVLLREALERYRQSDLYLDGKHTKQGNDQSQ